MSRSDPGVAGVEVRGGPALSLQLEARSGKLLNQGVLPAFGAGFERLVGKLLDDILFKAAGRAFVTVNRHDF